MIYMSQASTHTAARPEWTLEDRLIKARKFARLSQTDLGRLLGLHYKSVQKYELGQLTIKRGLILGWAMACGVDAEWLEGTDGSGGGTPLSAPSTGGEQAVILAVTPRLLKLAS